MAQAEGQAFLGVETEKQEKALLRRTLPMLDVRVAELGEGHRVCSVSALDV